MAKPTQLKDPITGEPIPNLWQLQVELPRLESDPRRRRRKFYRFHGGARDAEREQRRLQRLADSGEFRTSKLTVGELFDRFLAEHVLPRQATSTYIHYYTALTSLYTARIRELPLAKVAPHDLIAYESYLRTTPRQMRRVAKGANTAPRPRERRLSPTSVQSYCTAVRAAFAWGEMVELLPGRNPAARWTVSTDAPAERPIFTRQEAQRFLGALASSPYRLPLLVLATTGMRLSELRGLRWQDLDLDAGTFVIRRQVQFLSGGDQASRDVVRETAKSRSGLRGGAFADDTLALLRAHRLAQVEQRLAAGVRWRANVQRYGELVFSERDGAPLVTHRLRRSFYTLLAEHHLQRLRVHDLRHSWLSLQVEAGTPLHEASKLMGHANEAITRRVYYHLQQGAGRAAAARLANYLQAAGSQ